MDPYLKQLKAELLYKHNQTQKWLRLYDNTADEKAKKTLFAKAVKWGNKVALLADKITQYNAIQKSGSKEIL